MLALVVELLVTALTGAAMGFEATSFFVDEGNRPRLGQAFLVIDPDAFAGRARRSSIASRRSSRKWREDRAFGCPGARRRTLAEAAASHAASRFPLRCSRKLARLAG